MVLSHGECHSKALNQLWWLTDTITYKTSTFLLHQDIHSGVWVYWKSFLLPWSQIHSKMVVLYFIMFLKLNFSLLLLLV